MAWHGGDREMAGGGVMAINSNGGHGMAKSAWHGERNQRMEAWRDMAAAKWRNISVSGISKMAASRNMASANERNNRRRRR